MFEPGFIVILGSKLHFMALLGAHLFNVVVFLKIYCVLCFASHPAYYKLSLYTDILKDRN